MASGKRKQVPLTMDRGTSQKLLQRLQHDEDRKRSLGIDSIDERRSRSVFDALADYLGYLAWKDNSAEYIKTTEQRLRKLLKAAKTKTIADLDSSSVMRTLASWRNGKRSISIGTSNHYVGSVKSFSHWLVRESHLKADPLIGLRKMNADVDRRRIRRAFTDDELKRLLLITQESKKTYRGEAWQFTCRDRVMLYTLAANTGLRAKELASLTIHSFDLESKIMTVEASNTKNRQRAVLPLSELLFERCHRKITLALS